MKTIYVVAEDEEDAFDMLPQHESLENATTELRDTAILGYKIFKLTVEEI